MRHGRSIARWALVGGLTLLGGGLVVAGGAPVVNNALSVWFVEGDPARTAYERFQDLFGNDEVVVLAVGTAGKPLTLPVRRAIAAAAEDMRRVQGIASVLGPDDADAGPLTRLLVNRDGSVALLVGRLEVMADADARRHEILEGLRASASGLRATGVELHWAGIGLVYDELNQVSFRETPLLTGASFVVVGLVLRMVAGSMGPVLVALSSVTVSIMILMGLFTLMGFELNMVTAILPTLVLVVGTATAVHIVSRLRGVGDEAAADALRDVFKPCLFTSLTTAAGFASLLTARLAVIRELGGFAAVGVLVSLAVTFAFAWALAGTGWLGARRTREARSRWLLERCSAWATRHPWRILGGAVVASALALWGAMHVVVDTYSIEFFRKTHPVRVDSDAIEAAYGSYLPLEFAVRSPATGGAADAELIRSIAAWQRKVENAGMAQWSLSLADFRGAPGATVVSPASAGLLTQEGSVARVTFGVPMASARGWEERIGRIQGAAGDLMPEGVVIDAGGYLPLYVRMMQYIVDTQVWSFAAALVLVFALMGVFLRSRHALLAAVAPNLIPILLVFGVMGTLGIRLDIATVTVAAIALGIVVDDTVHLLFHFRRALGESPDRAGAVRAAVAGVGPALVGTTVVLASSFAILGFASVLSIALFGVLCAMTLIFALLADLLVLPALLMVLGSAAAPSLDPASRGAP